MIDLESTRICYLEVIVVVYVTNNVVNITLCVRVCMRS